MSATYPKDFKTNLAWRAKIIRKANRDQLYRLKIRKLYFLDPLFAFNAFFFTYDPREHRKHQQPFCTYEFQDITIHKMVDAITRGYDLPLEKSRDMGASWMIIGVYVWFWTNPEGGADFLLGSRVEKYVDEKGNIRTLMEKARYIINRLPRWLKPKGYSLRTHDNFMKIVNPETGSSLTGESNNPNYSTGGRYRSILLDEFPKWDYTDYSAWGDSGDASPCRIPIGTPFGAAGQYYDLITDDAKPKITLHWSLHPKKCIGLYCIWPKPPWVPKDAEVDETHWWRDPSRTVGSALRSEWYDQEWARRTPSEIAQNLDIDYIGAGNPVFDGQAGARIDQLMRDPHLPDRCFAVDFLTNKLIESPLPREPIGYYLEWGDPDTFIELQVAIATDVAEGKEDGDFTVVKILDRTSRSLIGTYAGRIDEVGLAQLLDLLGKRFPRYWLGIETNGPGLATFDICASQLQMPYLFMMPKYDVSNASVSYIKGWRTNVSSKRVLVSGIREWLIEAEGWTDQRCLREMTTFVRDATGKKAEAKSGAHDDEVIAWGLAIQVDLASPLDIGSRVVVPEMLTHKELASRGTRGPAPVPTTEELCFQQALAKQGMQHQGDLLHFDSQANCSKFEYLTQDLLGI